MLRSNHTVLRDSPENYPDIHSLPSAAVSEERPRSKSRRTRRLTLLRRLDIGVWLLAVACLIMAIMVWRVLLQELP